jgi:hypothetical protein
LDAYLGGLYGTGLSEEEQFLAFVAQQNRIEDLKAQCMTDQGFDYVPYYSAGRTVADGASLFRQDDRAWVEEYGYGIIRDPVAEAQQAEGYKEPVDPNLAYRDSLSESELAAYNEAEGGAPQEPAFDAAGNEIIPEYRWEDAGCVGWAQHEVEITDPANAPEFAPLFEAVAAFSANLYWDGEAFADIDAAWAACMADAGYPGLRQQRDAQTSFFADYTQPFMDSWDINSNLRPQQSDGWQALAEPEIVLALADLDCREATDYRNRYREIQFAAEEQFIADHQAEFDALRAAVEQGGSSAG